MKDIEKLCEESDQRVDEMIDAFCARNGEQAREPLDKLVSLIDVAWGQWLLLSKYADNADSLKRGIAMSSKAVSTSISLALDVVMPAGASEEDRNRESAFLGSLSQLRLYDVTEAFCGVRPGTK
jgi:hypothetical protein